MILIVDDHLDSGAALARLLKRFGHEAIAVGDGRAALTILRSVKPSVVVLDMMMPEMDGLEVLREIRADAEVRDIPVVVYSADYTIERLHQAQALGARDYLVKGCTPWERVCETVARYAN